MRPGVTHPARIVPLAFLAAVGVGTVLLSLPIATPGPESRTDAHRAFTSVSAVCVTGLIDRRHRHLLVTVRSGRDPGADPGRRASGS